MGNRVTSCVQQHYLDGTPIRRRRSNAHEDVQPKEVKSWLKESKEKHPVKASEEAAKRLSVILSSSSESPAIRRAKSPLEQESQLELEGPWEKKADGEPMRRVRPFSEYKETAMTPTVTVPRISCHIVGIEEETDISTSNLLEVEEVDPLHTQTPISQDILVQALPSEVMSNVLSCYSSLEKQNLCKTNFALQYPLQDMECSLRHILQEFLTQVYPLTASTVQQLEHHGLLKYLKWNIWKESEPFSFTPWAVEFFHGLVYSPGNLLTLADVLSSSSPGDRVSNTERLNLSLAKVIRCCVDLLEWMESVQFTRSHQKVPLSLVFDQKNKISFQTEDLDGSENSILKSHSFAMEIVFHSPQAHTVTNLNGMKTMDAENAEVRLYERSEEFTDQTYAISLDLSGFHLRDEDWFKFATISSTYENICELSLAESNTSIDTLTEVLRGYSGGKHLHLLNLKFNNLSSQDQLNFFTKSPSSLVNLVHLNLSCCELQCTAIYHLLQCHSSNLAQLNILDLSYNNFSTLRVKGMQKLLNLRLKKLNLRCTQISVECAGVMFDWLKRNRRLLTLDISGNHLLQHESAVIQLAAGIAYNATLKELFCENIGLRHTNRSIHIFSKAALMNRSLEVIDVSDNRLGDEGATALVDLVKWKSSLRVLHLNQCNITGRGIHTLLSACLTSELQCLNVCGNVMYLEPAQKKRITELHQQILSNRSFQFIV